MTDHRCVLCARREPSDGMTICGGCLDRISADLYRIAELVDAASRALTPATRPGNGGHTVPSSRPPLDVDALDAALGLGGGIVDPDPRDGIVQAAPVVLATLEDWIRMTREEAGLSPYGAATEAQRVTVASSVDFLRSWLPWAAERPDWPIEEYAREIRDLRGSLERFDPDREQARAGVRIECPGDHPDADGTLCGYRLTVDPSRPTEDVECRRCRTVWTSQRLVLVARFAPGGMRAWATAHELAEFLEVGTATIGKWHRRGLVTRMRTTRGWVYDIQQASAAHVDAGVAG